MSFLRRFGYAIGGLTVAELCYYAYWRSRETSHPFNAYTTAEQALNNMDLTGQTAIVTGGNTGIGKETARVLTKYGCNVILACRSQNRADDARKDILNNLGLSDDYDKLSVMILDLSSLDSVKTFADEFNSKNIQINYLINNAGISLVQQYGTTSDGFEKNFGVNHLGHFYLTNLLMPSLLKNDSNESNVRPRVINVSSSGHYMVENDYSYMNEMFDTAMKELKFYPESYIGDYVDMEAYALSKAANIFFSKELIKRVGNDKIVSVSLQPGAILDTELARNASFSDISFMIKALKFSWKWGLMSPNFVLSEQKSIPQGAATTVRCVSLGDNEIKNGSFYRNCRDDDNTVGGYVAQDSNGELAEKLWELSKLLIESKGHSI